MAQLEATAIPLSRLLSSTMFGDATSTLERTARRPHFGSQDRSVRAFDAGRPKYFMNCEPALLPGCLCDLPKCARNAGRQVSRCPPASKMQRKAMEANMRCYVSAGALFWSAMLPTSRRPRQAPAWSQHRGCRSARRTLCEASVMEDWPPTVSTRLSGWIPHGGWQQRTGRGTVLNRTGPTLDQLRCRPSGGVAAARQSLRGFSGPTR
jgi:hypothetical protein